MSRSRERRAAERRAHQVSGELGQSQVAMLLQEYDRDHVTDSAVRLGDGPLRSASTPSEPVVSTAVAAPIQDHEVGVGDDPLADIAEPDRTMAARVLAAMAIWQDAHDQHLWRGDPLAGGATTGDLAGFLYLRPMTRERDALNDSLTQLRRRGLLHFEFHRMLDEKLRWWLTDQGLAVARGLSTGRSGFERHAGPGISR